MRWFQAILTVGLGIWYMAGCKGMHEGYLDLSTGEEVTIEKDPITGSVINKDTRKPLYIYVDPVQEDTIYGKTGEVINGHVINKGNKFIYDKDETVKFADTMNKLGDTMTKYEDGDYKAKLKKDGSIKIKKGDRKIIIDSKGEIHEK